MATATTPNSTRPMSVVSAGRPLAPTTARSSAASVTPMTSCSTLQASSASSVGRSVVRRRLRVMFTMTTDDDRATHSPTTSADAGAIPAASATPPADGGRDQDLQRARRRRRPRCSRRMRAEIHLDPDLEEQEHDADVGEELDLLPVGDIARRERRHRDAEQQVADDGGQTDPPGDPAEARGAEQDEADLEDRRRGLHRGDRDSVRCRARLPFVVSSPRCRVPSTDRLWRSPRAEARLRHGHRRGRRTRAGDRLLPREEPRHHGRGGPGARLARPREHGPQHHGHPQQLPLGRERRRSTSSPSSSGRASRRTSTSTCC